MALADSRLPDALADLLEREGLPAPYLRIHDDDFGALFLVQSPLARAWAEDPDTNPRPRHLLEWLGVFPPVEGVLVEVQSFESSRMDEETELALWLFGGGHEGDGATHAPRIDPRMRAMLMFQEAQMMGARTTEAYTPKYNPLNGLRLHVGPDARGRFRRLRDGYAEIWGEARREAARALEPLGRSAEAYAAHVERVIVDPDRVQLSCRLPGGAAFFTLGPGGPQFRPLSELQP